MSENASTTKDTIGIPTATRRVLAIVLLAAGLVVVASSGRLHAWLIGSLPAAEAIIRAQPVLGVSVFLVFSALSAMLVFVSSAVIVPVAVYVWGKALTMLLLWVGWILGGICSYTLSRYFGRPVIKAMRAEAALASYENRISSRAPFSLVLLFQITVPSEVPGYLLGLGRYNFWKYLGALALAELPYALATTYLGAGFIQQQTSVLIGIGAALAVFTGLAVRALRRRLRSEPPAPENEHHVLAGKS